MITSKIINYHEKLKHAVSRIIEHDIPGSSYANGKLTSLLRDESSKII